MDCGHLSHDITFEEVVVKRLHDLMGELHHLKCIDALYVLRVVYRNREEVKFLDECIVGLIDFNKKLKRKQKRKK
jgi:hypothetical protein